MDSDGVIINFIMTGLRIQYYAYSINYLNVVLLVLLILVIIDQGR
jgi:hypothetical protein